MFFSTQVRADNAEGAVRNIPLGHIVTSVKATVASPPSIFGWLSRKSSVWNLEVTLRDPSELKDETQ